jgi:hypothetical protein
MLQRRLKQKLSDAGASAADTLGQVEPLLPLEELVLYVGGVDGLVLKQPCSLSSSSSHSIFLKGPFIYLNVQQCLRRSF